MIARANPFAVSKILTIRYEPQSTTWDALLARLQLLGHRAAIVGRDDGKIPRKYRELIAIAVACTTQCPYCLDVHTRNAKKAGATREEVTEAALLSAALRAGAATTHGALALKLFDQA